MTPDICQDDSRFKEPSGGGLVLFDVSSLRPLHANREAIDILVYPDNPENVNSLEEFLTRKFQPLFETWRSSAAWVLGPQLLSGRRKYRCRVFSFDGNSWRSTPLLVLLVERPPRPTHDTRKIAQAFQLTERELQTVEFLVDGLTSKEIADRMHISPNTVKAFIRQIMMKTSVSTRSGIVGKVLPLMNP
jgi:DNA-binding CsgD family transcriptional regulator